VSIWNNTAGQSAPTTGREPGSTSTKYKGGSGTSPSPLTAGDAGDIDFGSARRARRGDQQL
jgi:hypothetical protein